MKLDSMEQARTPT